MRKAIVLLMVVSFYSIARSQSTSYNVQAPELLPASPEPTAFVKASATNVSLSTGAANVSIPLYNLKVGDFSFPISLSYSTQGMKADEASSRVGIGWVLNCTGMITRSVKGQPDELTNYLKPPASLLSGTDSAFNYCNTASDADNPSWDTQMDEFQFNVNGYSGKFVLDTNGVARLTATENIRIEANQSGLGFGFIYITTPDGVKYRFKEQEQTTTHNIQGFNHYKSETVTAFFLDRIDMPNGDFIKFHYSSLHIKSATGMTEVLTVAKQGQGSGNCLDCVTLNSYSSQRNHIEYDTWYLDSIVSSEKQKIRFSYEERLDRSLDNRVKEISIDGVKWYKLSYYDVPGAVDVGGNNDIIGRFFLTKLSEKSLGDGENEDTLQNHVFTYDHMTEVGLPVVTGQDYLGYTNNASGGTTGSLIPTVTDAFGNINFSFRNPNHIMAKKGVLTTVQYPTGGKQEIIYEPNTISQQVVRNTRAEITMDGVGNNTYTFYNFSVPKTQAVRVSISAADANLGDGYSPGSAVVTVIMRIYEGATLVASRSSKAYDLDTTLVNLTVGHTYKLELNTKFATERGYFRLDYEASANPVYDTIITAVPGLRVREIRNNDGISPVTHSKFYTYTSLANPNWVSNGGGNLALFKSITLPKFYCDVHLSLSRECELWTYSSSSSAELYNYSNNGSVIYYMNVLESDDPGFANGGTEYTFFNGESGGNKTTILGFDVSNLPGGQYPTLTGRVQKTKVFDNNKQVISEEESEYETYTYMTNSVPSYYVRSRYTVNIALSDRMDAYDVIKMLYNNTWIRLKKKTNKQTEKGILQTVITNYTYGTTANIQPATVTTLDSRGLELKSATSYPTDFPADAIYQKLVAKNIILPAVEESSYRNSVLQQQKKVIYKDWFSDSIILKPEIIKLKESPSATLHDELIFTRYNTKGHPQEFNKINNIQQVYIWDSLHSLPVAEVKGAGFGQVAYAGFEPGAEYGNWTLTSGSVLTSPRFIGTRGFSGTLSKTISIAGVYTITLWTKNSVTVNSAAGTLIRTVRGWKLYQWQLTNPSTITVTGTLMDEVRLHPREAAMSSYSYTPYIGVTGIQDANNNVLYYEYDAHNRLLRNRDIDSVIVKQYRYKYQDTVIRCISNTPAWTATGVTKCDKNSNNNNTVEQREERDMNTCSPTYLQYRWYNLGATGNCPIVPSCTGANKRVVNGVCETGVKVYTHTVNHGSYYNCYWHYEFSDGYWSPEGYDTSPFDCGI